MFDFLTRGAVVVLSALSVAGAIGLAPGPLQSPGAEAALRPLPPLVGLADDRIAPVTVGRDPFAEPAPPRAVPAASQAAPTPPVSGTTETLPSNLPNDTIPVLPGSPPDPVAGGPRVTAVVTGPHPYAMLETAGDHEIKGLGDRVGGVGIVAIDIDGVRLGDGRRLPVDPETRP
jgi:hypothetical protein